MTAPISKQVFHDDIQEGMVGDGQFRNASPKGGWFFKVSDHNPCRKH